MAYKIPLTLRPLFDMLNPKNIMKLKKEEFGSDCNTELHLSFTNKTRKQINHEIMEKVIKQKKVFGIKGITI